MMASAKRSKGSGDKESQKGATHTVAEWVSLAASALLILALAGFLIFEAFQANEPFVPVQISARSEEAREVEGQFILPVHIVNRGGQTLRDLRIQLSAGAKGGAAPPTEMQIDYLGEGSEQVVYFYLDEHPRGLGVRVRASSYRVE